jgi:mono/diheme cytochrome c family protein
MIVNQSGLLILLIAGAFLLPAGLLAQGNHCVAQKSPKKMAVEAGQLIYTGQCVTCHQADGGGSASVHSPLIKSKLVTGSKQTLIELLIRGNDRHAEIDGLTVQNRNHAYPEMTDEEIANVLTFIRRSFGNKASVVKTSEVKTVREGIK